MHTQNTGSTRKVWSAPQIVERSSVSRAQANKPINATEAVSVGVGGVVINIGPSS